MTPPQGRAGGRELGTGRREHLMFSRTGGSGSGGGTYRDVGAWGFGYLVSLCPVQHRLLCALLCGLRPWRSLSFLRSDS